MKTTGTITPDTAEKLQADIYEAVKDEENDTQLQAALEYIQRSNR